MLTPDELNILRTMHRLKHPTTAQIHEQALPEKSRRSVQLALERLRRHGLIDVHLLYPEQGARSPRYYHLLLAGARAIGLERLGSNHYRVERREFFHARSVLIELEQLAVRHGWHLCQTEAEARHAVQTALLTRAQAQHGTAFPAHTISALLPHRLRPDRVLCTERETLVVLIAHPHAGRAFWRGRLHKYQRVLQTLRAVAIALTDGQRRECSGILEELRLTQRVLVLAPTELGELEGRLA